MKRFLLKWFITAVSIFVVANVFGLIYIQNLGVLVLAALLLGILNVFVRPMLFVLTLPINIVSLGLFTLVINGFLLYATAGLVSGFDIANFWKALLAAVLISIVTAMLNVLVRNEPKVTVHYVKRES